MIDDVQAEQSGTGAPRLVVRLKALLARDVLPITISTACRTLFGLAVAAVLVARFPPESSVRLFQILLLQTIFVTFVSGVGYGRAVSQSETEAGLAGLLRGFLLFALLVMGAMAILEATIVPRPLLDRFVSPDRWHFYALLAGGVATGLHGILQGAFVRRAGAFRVFMPVSAVSLVWSAALMIAPRIGMDGMIAAVVSYQIAILALFLAVNPAAAHALWDAARGAGENRRSLVASREALGFGIANALVLLVFFGFRQLWSERVDPELAEAAFFAVRLSEIYLGILFMTAASSRFLESHRYERRVALAPLAWLLIAVMGLALLLTAAVASGASLRGLAPLLVLCIGFQILCEGVRIPASMATLFEVQYGTMARYVLVTLPPTALAAGLALSIARSTPLFSFYAFQISMAVLQAFAVIVWRMRHEMKARRAGSDTGVK